MGGLLLPFIFGSLNFELERWFVPAVLGACAAYGDWFEYMTRLERKKWQKAVNLVVCIALFFILAYMRSHGPYNAGRLLYYIDGLWSFVIVAICFQFIGRIPVLKQVLNFLGKHSKNIFFVHAFFIMLFEEWIYSLKYAGLVYFCVLILSLAASMLLDFVKKLVRYQKMTDVLITKVLMGTADKA